MSDTMTEQERTTFIKEKYAEGYSLLNISRMLKRMGCVTSDTLVKQILVKEGVKIRPRAQSSKPVDFKGRFHNYGFSK